MRREQHIIKDGRKTITHSIGMAKQEASWDDLVELSEIDEEGWLSRHHMARVTGEFMRDAEDARDFVERALDEIEGGRA